MNYYWIIYDLVSFNNKLHQVQKEKYQKLIKELITYEIEYHSDNDHLPDHKGIAQNIKVSQGKMYSLLKELYSV
jgi:hypothetical protein